MTPCYGNTLLKKDTLIAMTSGEYSSYGIEGHYKILKDCDLEYLVECYRTAYLEDAVEYTELHPEGYHYKKHTGPKFSVWLELLGYIEPFKVTEVQMFESFNGCISGLQVS